jgi:D-beta-D-heptose 7-phosphate kinase/D-beta-D-heptose 1-phosphate adenosyltransferase
MDLINKFLEANKNKQISIHVIGDCMIDENYAVKITRISPESPNICVMLSENSIPTSILPGGAANICYQLTHFNVKSTLVTLTNPYSANIFRNSGISFLTVTDPKIHIPYKKRFFDGETQVGDRWDIEKPNYGLTSEELWSFQTNLSFEYQKIKNEADVVILSDYNKGLLDCGSSYFKFNPNTPIIVDPKKHPIEKWHGCTVFKPNAQEAESLSGLAEWKQQCDYFMDKLNCQAVIITQGSKGVTGKDKYGYFDHQPKYHLSASKPGAGDCFAGTFAVALGHGFTFRESAVIANEAGFVYVQQKSRESISLWDLFSQSKFVNPENLAKRNYKLVFTNGCYDILHSGHLECLRFAKSKGDKLVVAVNSDESVKRLKGPSRPVKDLTERMEMLAALECVDYVTSFNTDTPLDIIKLIQPDVLIKGEDWRDKTIGSEYVKEIHYVPLVKDKSTTNIIEKIKTTT